MRVRVHDITIVPKRNQRHTKIEEWVTRPQQLQRKATNDSTGPQQGGHSRSRRLLVRPRAARAQRLQEPIPQRGRTHTTEEQRASHRRKRHRQEDSSQHNTRTPGTAHTPEEPQWPAIGQGESGLERKLSVQHDPHDGGKAVSKPSHEHPNRDSTKTRKQKPHRNQTEVPVTAPTRDKTGKHARR